MALPNWDYREALTITGQSGSPQTDYQFKLTIPYNSYMNSDFSDLRFTDTDEETLIPYWVESKTDGVEAIVWVKLPNTPANGSSITYYMFYGNAAASSTSNGDDTFEFFDNFPGTSIDLTKWEGSTAFATVSNNVLTLTDTGSLDLINTAVYNHSINGVIIDCDVRYSSSNANPRVTGSGKYSGAAGNQGAGGFIRGSWGGAYVTNYDGSSDYDSTTLNLLTWYTMEVRLKPNSIESTINGVSASIANTLESHPISIATAGMWDLRSYRVRKYANYSADYEFSLPLSDWDYREALTITGQSGSPQTDYQFKLTIPYNSYMNSDFSDIRFTDTDEETLIPYWVESKTDGVEAIVWVKLPNTPANGSSITYYMFYGNAAASSTSNGDDTFEFFDNFPGTSIDLTKWEGSTAFATVSNNVLTLTDTGSLDLINTAVYNHSINGVIIDCDVRYQNMSMFPRTTGSWKSPTIPPSRGAGGFRQNYARVTDYAGNYDETAASLSSFTWYNMEVCLKPDSIESTINGVSASIANTLESHPISITTGGIWDLRSYRIRKYADYSATYKFSPPLSDWVGYQIITLIGKLSGAQTQYQLKLTVHYSPDMNSDFSDIRFADTEKNLIPYWIESKINNDHAIVWVKFPNTPANNETGEYRMYYGNSAVACDSNGNNTFIQYHGIATSNFNDAAIVPYNDVAFESQVYVTDSDSNLQCGLSNNLNGTDDLMCLSNSHVGSYFIYIKNENNATTAWEMGEVPAGQVQRFLFTRDNSGIHGYIDGDEIETGITEGNFPDENLGLWLRFPAGTGGQDWSFARKYVTAPAIYVFADKSTNPWSVIINNINYDNFEIIKTLDTIAGSKKFDVVFSSSEFGLSFNHYDNIEIYGESKNLIFTGRIEEITPNYVDDTTIISGRDYIAELMDKFVVQQYDTKMRSYIVNDLLKSHSANIIRSNIDDSPTGSEYTHAFKSSVWDAIVECASDDQYRFWVDAENNFYYKPVGYIDSGLSLELGVSDIYSFDIMESGQDIINQVTVIGSGNPQIIVTHEDIESQNYYGIIKAKQIFDNSIDTMELATTKADRYLSENAWALDMITFVVDGYEELNAGELITIKLPNHNIDGPYLVIDKIHQYPNCETTIKVARYEKNLEVIINNLINRINNLEQQTVISARIKRMHEVQGYSDPLKIYRRDIGSSFRLGVTGHCELNGKLLKHDTDRWYRTGGEWIRPTIAFASGYLGPTYLPEFACDGDIGTSWISNITTPNYIYFDLEERKTLIKIKVYAATMDAEGIVATIQTSDDSIIWTDVANHTFVADTWSEIEFTEIDARYVRIYNTVCPNMAGMLSEFEAYCM